MILALLQMFFLVFLEDATVNLWNLVAAASVATSFVHLR
jgi:hypothetical protein